MNKFKKIILLCLLLTLFISCSDDDVIDMEPKAALSAVVLIYPENNSECNEGIIISDTETDVLFKWEQAANASSYKLLITNLNTRSSREIKTNSNEFLIRVLRGTPYSWVVIVTAGSSDETVDSETWKFYNSGLPEESHPPFPANALNPQMGSSIDEGNITLQWETTDVDNDITSYTVLLDTANPPVAEMGNPSTETLGVTVSSGEVYYWKVITTDEIGNESHSQVFQFRVN